jgi:cytochrome c biogenesis protein CcmG, thiol:disulfide interchange protein DsbE
MEAEMHRRTGSAILAVIIVAIPAIVAAVEVGQPAPPFSLPALDGGAQVSLASTRGSVVVLDFWASWCQPCLAALPELDAMARDLGPRGLKVLAINIDEDAAVARAKLGKGPHLFMPLHDGGSKVATQYGVGDALPATVVVDRRGVVKLFQSGGAVEPARLRKLVTSLL